MQRVSLFCKCSNMRIKPGMSEFSWSLQWFHRRRRLSSCHTIIYTLHIDHCHYFLLDIHMCCIMWYECWLMVIYTFHAYSDEPFGTERELTLVLEWVNRRVRAFTQWSRGRCSIWNRLNYDLINLSVIESSRKQLSILTLPCLENLF